MWIYKDSKVPLYERESYKDRVLDKLKIWLTPKQQKINTIIIAFIQ
jgi:hypothetical protein